MQHESKLRVAIVKFAGMTIGGSELWLHKIAVNLPKTITVDFYYCDDTPYTRKEYSPAPTSQERIEYLKKNGVNVIKFSVKEKNVQSLTHDWVDTDFWEKFDEKKYDLVQTVKAGPKEYPFYKMSIPVVEIVALANRPDTSKNIAWSFHSSSWQRARWIRLGGSANRSSVLTAPVEKIQSTENYREQLAIPSNALVAGFHQRNDNMIASPVPLLAFSNLQKKFPEESKNWYFVIKNGGSFYREQATFLNITNISFLGRTPDTASVSKFLNTLDIFAHGRKDGETFGAVFVEAMIHGKPCLSHYVEAGANAQPETMGPAGVFAYSQKEYEDLLYTFFTDTAFRDKLARKAKPHVKKYYSIDRCIKEILEIYNKITQQNTDTEAEDTSKPLSYGYSDMGFLYAGDLESKISLAHHVLVGGIPEGKEVAIISSILPHTKNYTDIHPRSGIYGWLAAQYYTKHSTEDGTVTMLEQDKNYCKTLETIRELNNWENVVSLQQNLPLEQLISTDCISINTALSTQEDLEYLAKSLLKEKPVLLATHTSNETALTLADTLPSSYEFYRVTNSAIEKIKNKAFNVQESTYILLEREKHVFLIPFIQKALRDYSHKNFIFGIIKKEKVVALRNKIIPPYITITKILSYSKRILRIS